MTFIFAIGQIIFGGYFIYSSYNHFKNHAGMTGYAKSKGIPMAGTMVYVTAVLLLFGGLTIITGRYIDLGIIALVLFLIPTTFMMHNFWKETDPMSKMNQTIGFTKNLALIGALFMLFALI